MEQTLQYEEITQCIKVSPTSTRNHNSYGAKTDYALKINSDQSNEDAQGDLPEIEL